MKVCQENPESPDREVHRDEMEMQDLQDHLDQPDPEDLKVTTENLVFLDLQVPQDLQVHQAREWATTPQHWQLC